MADECGEGYGDVDQVHTRVFGLLALVALWHFNVLGDPHLGVLCDLVV